MHELKKGTQYLGVLMRAGFKPLFDETKEKFFKEMEEKNMVSYH